MLEQAWSSARRWAAEARAKQKQARRQAHISLAIAALAALLAAFVAAVGAPPSPAPGTSATLPWHWTSFVSAGAGVLAAIAAIFGRHVLDSKAEAQWIAARAAAEATQSECYRYAARVAPYEGDDAAAALAFDQTTRIIADSARGKGAINLQPGIPNPDRPPPPMGMTAEWYRQNRLLKQQDWYIGRAGEHRSQANQLRMLTLGFGILAATLGILGAINGLSFLTAGVGAVTTIAASIAAYGSLDRQSFLAGSYAGMADAIGSLLGRHDAQLLTDKRLVEEAESLLGAEYRAWADRMANPGQSEAGQP
ncbi:DUF4231 domain-containing protein [Roseomonas sp. GCM10028921]